MVNTVVGLKNINFMTEAQYNGITPVNDELYAVNFINFLTSKANADGSNISEAETFRNNIEAPCMPKQAISATATSSQIGDIVGINQNAGATTYTLPPGGTWFCYVYKNSPTSQALTAAPRGVIAAGGTTLSLPEGEANGYLYGMAWRIA